MNLPGLAEIEYSTLNCICEIRLSSSEMIDNVHHIHVYSRFRGRTLPEGLTIEQFNRSLHLLEYHGMISLSPNGEAITLTTQGFNTYISCNKISLEKEQRKVISFITKYLTNNNRSLTVLREHFYEENRYSDFIIKDLKERGLVNITYTLGGYVMSNASPLLNEISF